MSILNYLTPVIEKIPPEGVDLFVCADPEDFEYNIARFYHKGSKIKELGFSKAEDPVQRFIEDITGMHDYYKKAETTGFYILDDVGSKDGGCHWRALGYNPLECSYVVIRPEDE